MREAGILLAAPAAAIATSGAAASGTPVTNLPNGPARIVFALTRGERAHAYAARSFAVTVR